MRTYTHRFFNPEKPESSQISIVDISHGLSMQARWCGQLEEFYSVAEHCVMVAEILEHAGHQELAFAGLLHDAHEAYTSDIPSPVKQILKPLITEVEEKIDTAIFAKFGLSYPTEEQKAIIKGADNLSLLIEDRDLRGQTFEDITYPSDNFPFHARPVGQVKAKIRFMEKFMDLLEKSQEAS